MFSYSFVFLQNTFNDVVTPGQPNVLAMLGQLFFVIAAFIFVAVLAYYSTKWIATSKYARQGAGNIRIIENKPVGHQCGILLIEAGGKYLLIGVSKERMTLLTELDAQEIVAKKAGEPAMNIPFQKFLDQFIKKKNED